jgi:hypothetical protein
VAFVLIKMYVLNVLLQGLPQIASSKAWAGQLAPATAADMWWLI